MKGVLLILFEIQQFDLYTRSAAENRSLNSVLPHLKPQQQFRLPFQLQFSSVVRFIGWFDVAEHTQPGSIIHGTGCNIRCGCSTHLIHLLMVPSTHHFHISRSTTSIMNVWTIDDEVYSKILRIQPAAAME